MGKVSDATPSNKWRRDAMPVRGPRNHLDLTKCILKPHVFYLTQRFCGAVRKIPPTQLQLQTARIRLFGHANSDWNWTMEWLGKHSRVWASILIWWLVKCLSIHAIKQNTRGLVGVEEESYRTDKPYCVSLNASMCQGEEQAIVKKLPTLKFANPLNMR